MSRKKFDGVIEAVHYDPAGQVEWARVYERRGSAFSDLLIISRAQLMERLKGGKKYMIGQRIPYMAGTFKTGKKLNLVAQGQKQYLTTESQPVEKDTLAETPVI